MNGLQAGLARVVGTIKLAVDNGAPASALPANDPAAVTFSKEAYLSGAPLPGTVQIPSQRQTPTNFTAQVVDEVMNGGEVIEEAEVVGEFHDEDQPWAPRPRMRGWLDQACADLEWIMYHSNELRNDVFHCSAAGCGTHGKLDANIDGKPQFYVPNPEVATAFGINPLEHVMCDTHRVFANYHFDQCHVGVMNLLGKPKSEKDLWRTAVDNRKFRRHHSVPLASYLAAKLDEGSDLEIPAKARGTSADRPIVRDMSSLSESKGLIADANWLVGNFPTLESKTFLCMTPGCDQRHVAYSIVNGDVNRPHFYALSEEMQDMLNLRLGFYISCHKHLKHNLEWIGKKYKMGTLVLREKGIRGIPLTEYFISPFLHSHSTRQIFDEVYGHVPYSKVLKLVTSWVKK